MRLLIAGWQGQVARAFVEAVPGRADITACALGRPALDICEARSIERALADAGPDVVINAAAYTAVDQAESEPERCFALNRDGARLLAEAAARRGVPIIHISTDYVFDGTKIEPYVEADSVAPQTVYGRSKREGELAVIAANPRHLILRTAWVFSPFGKNFVKTILRLAGERDVIRVVADQRGSPTYAPNLVSAILDVASQIKDAPAADPRWGIYHAAGSGAATWFDVAREVLAAGPQQARAVAVEPITSADYPTPALRPANSVLDCSKLADTFSVRLADWRHGVTTCVSRLGEEVPAGT